MEYKSIELDGNIYVKVNNKWLDSSFIVPPVQIINKLLEKEIASIDIEKAPIEQVKLFITEAKQCECYALCLKIVETLIKRSLIINDLETIKYFISVKTSCLRGIRNPHGAIEFYNEMKKKYGTNIVRNVATLTSLSAAYCDIDDWESAEQTAKRAYALQGGNQGYVNELSLVFKRIQANKQ